MEKWTFTGALGVLLAACGPVPDTADVPVEKVVEGGGILEEPRRDTGMQIFVAVAENPDWGRIEAEARALCEGKTHCGVMGWTDPAQMPSAMPMLDREVSAMAFSYSLNRTTAYEQFLIDCTQWPHGEPSKCLAKPDATE